MLTRKPLTVIILTAGLAITALTVMLKPGSTLTSDVSPRDFCRQQSGTVTETGLAHVYICCYAHKQKCILSNTRRGQSRKLILSWNDQEKT